MNRETRNFFDPPFIAMIDSGTFWRCPHGRTRFSDKGVCKRCGVRRPVKFARHIWRAFRAALAKAVSP